MVTPSPQPTAWEGPPCRKVEVKRAGSTIRGELVGPTGAALVVFIHGGFMDRRMFDGQVPAVVAAGNQVLSWDVRGHGESLPRGAERPSVADLAADLFALLDEVGHTAPVILVGQSLGGMIAQRAALTTPARVAGLVIIGAPCVNPADPKISRRMAAMWRVSNLITGLLPSSAIRRQLPKGTAVTAQAQQYVRAAVATVTKEDFRWLTEASREAGQGLRGQRIEAPQLIVRGALDNSGAGRLTALTAAHWTSRDPHARYELIPAAGHQAHQDQPELFNRLLLDFISARR
ncbi:alpha/beta hydrolase [Natronosporangium hydrolyticum]|uniref:Alpha/beta hydrolase n=1 Tax=Natronosporangium hydrolyticum TaxID=2811111 RepID=A0A895YJ83_9ACTN|nr:alpha/beta hydrolase [Natronosporangium hydrolyticum]QSB13838.1 alpha/beta hydrolase [Natronosporangium hydrolyticum]